MSSFSSSYDIGGEFLPLLPVLIASLHEQLEKVSETNVIRVAFGAVAHGVNAVAE